MYVPKNIKRFATSLGYNFIRYAGAISEVKYYGIGIVDEAGMMLPLGLPAFIKDEGGRLSLVEGEAGLEISRRLLFWA